MRRLTTPLLLLSVAVVLGLGATAFGALPVASGSYSGRDTDEKVFLKVSSTRTTARATVYCISPHQKLGTFRVNIKRTGAFSGQRTARGIPTPTLKLTGRFVTKQRARARLSVVACAGTGGTFNLKLR